jgi:nicotinic acid phosphoribosyltransferase
MPNSASPELKAAAQRLLAYESAAGKPSDANRSAGFRICEKLRAPLAKLLGVDGFRSLLFRALTLAGAEALWLRALRINTDGSMEGLHELEAKLDSSAIAEGEIVLVGHLLGLLLTFIGPTLTTGLLRDVWPKMDDWNLKRATHEEK